MSRAREKLCVYVEPETKRKLMHLRADTRKDMSDLAELALKMLFEIVENGELTKETRETISELRAHAAMNVAAPRA